MECQLFAWAAAPASSERLPVLCRDLERSAAFTGAQTRAGGLGLLLKVQCLDLEQQHLKLQEQSLCASEGLVQRCSEAEAQVESLGRQLALQEERFGVVVSEQLCQQQLQQLQEEQGSALAGIRDGDVARLHELCGSLLAQLADAGADKLRVLADCDGVRADLAQALLLLQNHLSRQEAEQAMLQERSSEAEGLATRADGEQRHVEALRLAQAEELGVALEHCRVLAAEREAVQEQCQALTGSLEAAVAEREAVQGQCQGLIASLEAAVAEREAVQGQCQALAVSLEAADAERLRQLSEAEQRQRSDVEGLIAAASEERRGLSVRCVSMVLLAPLIGAGSTEAVRRWSCHYDADSRQRQGHQRAMASQLVMFLLGYEGHSWSMWPR